MSKKKFLITGGTGFLGSALVRRLVRDGYDVRVLDNNLRGVPSRLKEVWEQIEVVEGDIRDLATVESACKEVDAICHLAFINGTRFFYEKPDLILEIAVKGMMNVLDAAIKHQVKELFLASSSEVYQAPPRIPTDEAVPLVIPDPMNPRFSYGGGKIINELLAIHYGKKYFNRAVIFRPHNVYGPDMGGEHVIPELVVRMKELMNTHLEGVLSFPIQGTGKETRSFIYIDDFIEALMYVIRSGEHLGIYHIGTMEEIPVEEVASQIAHVLGQKIEIIPGKKLEGSTPRRCPNTQKLQRLGFQPKISFQEGLRKTVEWYRERSLQ